MIRHPFFAFFDEFAAADLDIIAASPVLFRLAVSDTAFKSGRWAVVGRREVSPGVAEPMWFYRQDHFTGGLSIMNEQGYETTALPEQCRDLECAAVWEPVHVESRLSDHLAGRPNKWLLSMALKEKP
jgi:hypothetical protein